MKIAIVGCRGIPNRYGGFEQFAEYLASGLVKEGHQVYVYNSHNHPFQESIYNKVNIIHKFDPEFLIGTAGQFLYDLLCILDSRKRGYDLMLQLGYTSNSIWYKLLPRSVRLVTNMDGMEWRRPKYNRFVKAFLKYAESLAVKSSDTLIVDSPVLKRYFRINYRSNSTYIPYAARIFNQPQPAMLDTYNAQPYQYDLIIARLEPDNNIEMILDGVCKSEIGREMLVIGNNHTRYGKYLSTKYRPHPKIKFLGFVYEQSHLNNLRYYSNIYFHGHSVGGTNPSLLEAMACNTLICAHDNIFNRCVLEKAAYYFKNTEDVDLLLSSVIKNSAEIEKVEANQQKVNTNYGKDNIVERYNRIFSDRSAQDTRRIHDELTKSRQGV